MRHNQIPVACVQTRAHDRVDFDRAWPRIVARVEEAGRRGARLIVLPEATVPGYVLGNEPVSDEQLERAASHIAALARRFAATIVYGSAKREGNRTVNAAIVVGPDGCELGYAAKQFLWHFDRRWFAPGATLEPIDTPLGKLGVLVCADGRIPTIAATLVERGAVMLVMPTAWVTSGRDPRALENLQADLMANVRARENGVPFVVANKCGVELESVAYCGKSALIDADGAFVARGSERDEEIVFGELTPGEGRPFSLAPALALDPTPALEAGSAREHPGGAVPLRIAFTTARGADVARFAALAADADADLILARAPLESDARSRLPVVEVLPTFGKPRGALGLENVRGALGFEPVLAEPATVRDPRGLVESRLRGHDVVIWHADGDPVWDVALARTRAAELRMYIVTFGSDGRAFAVDPDGAVVAGTFDDFRVATFVYDRARAAATLVAPTTDVLTGLREAERIRALPFAGTPERSPAR